MAAVASVIRNRLAVGGYGKSPSEIVRAPNQFEPWNPDSGNDPVLVSAIVYLPEQVRMCRCGGLAFKRRHRLLADCRAAYLTPFRDVTKLPRRPLCVTADGHFLLAFARIQSSRILLTRLEIVRLSAFASLVRAAFTAALIRAVNTTGRASFALGICIALPCVTCFLTKIDANGRRFTVNSCAGDRWTGGYRYKNCLVIK
jgi:hypothetical protein